MILKVVSALIRAVTLWSGQTYRISISIGRLLPVKARSNTLHRPSGNLIPWPVQISGECCAFLPYPTAPPKQYISTSPFPIPSHCSRCLCVVTMEVCARFAAAHDDTDDSNRVVVNQDPPADGVTGGDTTSALTLQFSPPPVLLSDGSGGRTTPPSQLEFQPPASPVQNPSPDVREAQVRLSFRRKELGNYHRKVMTGSAQHHCKEFIPTKANYH